MSKQTKSDMLLRKFLILRLTKAEIESLFKSNETELKIKLPAFINQAAGISSLNYDVGKILEQVIREKQSQDEKN